MDAEGPAGALFSDRNPALQLHAAAGASGRCQPVGLAKIGSLPDVRAYLRERTSDYHRGPEEAPMYEITNTFLASEITPKMKHRRTSRATPVSASVSTSASVSASVIPAPEPLVAKSTVPQDLDEDESDGKGNSVLFTMSQV